MSHRFTMAAVVAASLASHLPTAALAAGVDPTIIPVNSQIGSVRVPLKCSFPVIGNQTLNIKLTGSMATSVTPGQSFYMTDGSGVLELPQGLVDAAYTLLGARQGSGSISELNFNLVNATPSTINGLNAPIIVPPTPIKAGVPLNLLLPSAGFLQVGPMVATDKPGQVLVKLGSAKGVLKLLTSTGKNILWDLGVACAAPDPSIIVLGMTVSGTPSSEVSAPHTNIRTEDLEAPFMTQAGSLRFPLSCNLERIGRREIDGTFTGIAPVRYAPGEVFNAATNGYGNLVLPDSVVNEMLAQVPTARTISASVDKLTFNSTNTTPSTIDLAAGGALKSAQSSLVAGQRSAMRIPAEGFLTVGKFKATTLTSGKESDTALYIGETGATVAIKNADGQVVDTRRVDCDAPNPPTTMVSVTIGGKAVYPAAVTGVLPASGSSNGGTTVYLTGTNFTDARAVTFGGMPAAKFSVISSNLIAVTTPAHQAGAVSVVVQGVGGSAKEASFTYK